MSAPQPNAAEHGPPSPFPEGWYFVGTSRQLKKSDITQMTWMGEEIVVWHDDEGRICVSEAYCPHLGSYLGPDAGGRVCDGRLVCPFHGFEFNADGQCVATPYAPAPRSARLQTFATREICGMVFAWWGIGGRDPQWQLPENEPDQTGWSNIEIRTLRFPGHPQETTENSVDLAHLQYVHGYDQVNGDYPVRVDGPYLESRFDFKSRRRIAHLFNVDVSVSACARIHGLGYSFVEFREHNVGTDMRLWILATPIDGEMINLSIVNQVKEIRSPNRNALGFALLPVRWRAPLVNKLAIALQRNDVQQDVTIWSRKRYVRRPRLCRSDGEIMTYRAYCAQFYPLPDEAPPATCEPARSAELARQ